jgi:DNA invertase Pin-like site-specific DNA recombinase
MPTTELVTAHHLNRKAIVYIRQSSPHQMLSNQESLRLQYALRQQALEMGWAEEQVEVIDHDLGQTGASIAHREGFKDLLAQVTLGQVGIILSYDVTRLSRNCSDWYPLLDLCGYKRCLIGDREGIYDPGTPNGRLLLGLKGQISEVELYTIRSRLTAGILNKAERGELALSLPVGLIRDELGVVHKDPNREVQERIGLVFETFLQLRTASKVLGTLNQQNLLLPRHNRFHDVVWRKPTISSILSILKNPAYAGAFVYGRTRAMVKDSDPRQTQQRQVPMNEWKIRVNDKYPAYISWEIFEQIQAQLRDNHAEYDRNKTRGIPREGSALLHGIVYCGECGHKLVVQYKNGTRYLCNYLRQQYRVPVCQYIPADVVDDSVVNAFFAALSPVQLDAYSYAVQAQQKSEDAIERAHQQQLERLRYQAALAERQFNQVDPDNRLVASELEKRWENALAELQQAQFEQAQRQHPRSILTVSAELKSAFTEIGQKLPEIWNNSILTRAQKKSLLRCLIDKVIIHRVGRDVVHTRIVWKGGDTTTIELPIPVSSMAELADAPRLETRIVELARQGVDDQSIAEQLTAENFRSPMRLTLLPSTVKRIRLQHGIMIEQRQSHRRQIPGYLTIPQIATALQISKHWIYDRIHKGTIVVGRDPTTNLYLFPDQPSTLAKFKQLQAGTVQELRFS